MEVRTSGATVTGDEPPAHMEQGHGESFEKAPEEEEGQQESPEKAPDEEEEQHESSEKAPEEGHATSDDEHSDDDSDVSSDFETSELSPESLTGKRFYDAVKSYCGTDNTSVQITGEYDQCCKQTTTSKAAFGIRFEPRPDKYPGTEDTRYVSLVQGEWTIQDREANCFRTGVFENGLLVSERQRAAQAEARWAVPLRHANKTLWVMESDGPKCVIGGGDEGEFVLGKLSGNCKKMTITSGWYKGSTYTGITQDGKPCGHGKVVTEREGKTLEAIGIFDECYRKLHGENCTWITKDSKTDGPLKFHAYDPEEGRNSERNGDAALYTHPGADGPLTAQYAYQLYCYSYQRRIKDKEKRNLFRHFTKFTRSQYDIPNSILKDFCTSGIDMMISKTDTGEDRIKTTLVTVKEFYKGKRRDIIYFCHGAGPRRQAMYLMRALLSYRMGLTMETCMYAKFDKTTLPDITENLFDHVEDVFETADGGDSTSNGQCYMRFDARKVKGAATTEDMIILQKFWIDGSVYDKMVEQGEIAANATLNVDGNPTELPYSNGAQNWSVQLTPNCFLIVNLRHFLSNRRVHRSDPAQLTPGPAAVNDVVKRTFNMDSPEAHKLVQDTADRNREAAALPNQDGTRNKSRAGGKQKPRGAAAAAASNSPANHGGGAGKRKGTEQRQSNRRAPPGVRKSIDKKPRGAAAAAATAAAATAAPNSSADLRPVTGKRQPHKGTRASGHKRPAKKRRGAAAAASADIEDIEESVSAPEGNMSFLEVYDKYIRDPEVAEKIKRDRSIGKLVRVKRKTGYGVVVNRHGEDHVVRYLDAKATIKIASEEDIVTYFTRANVQGESCHKDAEFTDLKKSTREYSVVPTSRARGILSRAVSQWLRYTVPTHACSPATTQWFRWKERSKNL